MIPPLPRRSPSSGLRIELEELVRLGLLRPTAAQLARGLRRELRLPPFNFPRPPRAAARQVCWSGEARAVVVWSKRCGGQRLIGYCHRADAWASDPRAVFG